MGLRFRRSIKLAPGVKLNVTKSGLGVTAGGKYARYSVHSSGRRTVGMSVPGTGAYYQQSSFGGRRGNSGLERSGPRRVATQPMAPVNPISLIPKPGLLASGAEKAYHEGVLAYLRGDQPRALARFESVLSTDLAAVSAHLFAGVAATALNDRTRAISHLEAVVAHPNGLPDRYQAKYLPNGQFTLTLHVKITEAVPAAPPFGELAAALALAELYQDAGRLEEAIGLLQQLHEALPDPLLRLSLCDLLFADGDNDGVIEMASGVTNDSNVSVETLHLKAAALLTVGHGTAALDVFRDALAKTSGRDPDLLKAVRYDRALTFLRLGQKGRAKADLERLYAQDPAFEDVRERLAALAT